MQVLRKGTSHSIGMHLSRSLPCITVCPLPTKRRTLHLVCPVSHAQSVEKILPKMYLTLFNYRETASSVPSAQTSMFSLTVAESITAKMASQSSLRLAAILPPRPRPNTTIPLPALLHLLFTETINRTSMMMGSTSSHPAMVNS